MVAHLASGRVRALRRACLTSVAYGGSRTPTSGSGVCRKGICEGETRRWIYERMDWAYADLSLDLVASNTPG
jgi:hypothetical protein